jgi:hypothetical protein
MVQHQRQEETIRRRLDDITDSIDNLIRALERTRSPGGQFSTRTQARIAELEQRAADLTRQLMNHQAVRPPTPSNDLTVLNHLPVAAIDLNDLSTERLRRFLDAFHVEIHYDVRVRRATVRAEISAELVDRLTRAVGWAACPQPTRAASKTRDENGPTDDGGATQTIMHSSGRCPRQDSNLRPRLRRAVLYPLSYGGSATSTTLAGAADG